MRVPFIFISPTWTRQPIPLQLFDGVGWSIYRAVRIVDLGSNPYGITVLALKLCSGITFDFVSGTLFSILCIILQGSLVERVFLLQHSTIL
ncbi:hypothetical protein F0562_024804 [Nyssa sinensis]|uniref:Uncharacterized protein n=1 Tax=Nyssa sinensis TaxID=561372 RepID=A0A5J5BI97_9ASTE|nr:hypothetical protein F0562_024804 [Nyssa sinensis]